MWKDILKVDGKKLLEDFYAGNLDISSLSSEKRKIFMDAYEEHGRERQKTTDEFAKEIEPMIEKILNYYVSDESDYNDETRDKLRTALNSAFNFNRIHVDYVPEDLAFYIDISEGEEGGVMEGEVVEYKFDKDGNFKRIG
tara:strand:- start:46 stop:465 length:420 start_codon:yes stop_codon:yes gene_type:complete